MCSLDEMVERARASIHFLHADRKDHLDVLLLHSPRCWAGHCTAAQEAVSWQQAWRNLERLYDMVQTANR